MLLRFGKTKVAKEEFYGAKKKKLIIQLFQNNSSKYLNGYLDDVIQSFVFILPKMSEYVKAFKEKNNKLMSFRIDYDKQLEKHNQLN